MQVNLKIFGDESFEGICPACKEYTTAGDSCCGEGAYVEGALVSDEEALESAQEPHVTVRLLTNVSEDVARRLHSTLFALNIPSTMFGYSQENTWNVNVFVPVSFLSQQNAKPSERSEE